MHELLFRVFFENNAAGQTLLLYKGRVPRRNEDFVLPSGTWNITMEIKDKNHMKNKRMITNFTLERDELNISMV